MGQLTFLIKEVSVEIGFEFANYETQQGFFLIWCNSYFYSLTPVLKELKKSEKSQLNSLKNIISPVIPLNTSKCKLPLPSLLSNYKSFLVARGGGKNSHILNFPRTQCCGEMRNWSFFPSSSSFYRPGNFTSA